MERSRAGKSIRDWHRAGWCARLDWSKVWRRHVALVTSCQTSKFRIVQWQERQHLTASMTTQSQVKMKSGRAQPNSLLPSKNLHLKYKIQREDNHMKIENKSAKKKTAGRATEIPQHTLKWDAKRSYMIQDRVLTCSRMGRAIHWTPRFLWDPRWLLSCAYYVSQ